MAADGFAGSKSSEEPRQDLRAERAVLAAVLLDDGGGQAVLPRVRAIIQARDFYLPAHGVIFEAMEVIAARREALDVLSLVAELRFRDRLNAVGGAQYIGEITDEIPTLAHCETHARIVAREAQARRVRTQASRALHLIDSGGQDLATYASAIAEAAASDIEGDDLAPVDVALSAELERFDGGGVTGRVPTGLAPLDDALCGGMGQSDYVVIAARTSVGKSALALQIADAIASRGDLVLYFSMEMPKAALAQRLAAQRSGIDLGRVRSNNLTDAEVLRYRDAVRDAHGLPLRISDRRGLRPSQIRARCLAAKARAGSLGCVVIDYLQITAPERESDNRARDVGSISHAFQALPGELGCPVIAICTLSRKADAREGPPKLGDLRESGDLEYDADAVIFLWREGGDRAEPRATVAKQRNGPPCEEIPLAWDSSSIKLTVPPEGNFPSYQHGDDGGDAP